MSHCQEVTDKYEANFCATFYDVFAKVPFTVYFNMRGNAIDEMLQIISRDYSFLIKPGIRVEFYDVKLGHKVVYR